MKERLINLLDGMTENQIIYVFTLLSKLFGKGVRHG